MKRILFIFALSMFLISCQEETISRFRQCGRMTISDALPVQFWLTECETYNEHEPEGVHYRCWCQPFECADEISNIQIRHTDQFLSPNLYLKTTDSEYIFLSSFDNLELSAGDWLYTQQTAFIPEDIDICDEQIQLLIAKDIDTQHLLAPSSWTELSGAWTTKTGTDFTLVDAVWPPGPVDSYQDLDLIAGDIIVFDITTILSGTISSVFAAFVLTDDSVNPLSTVVNQTITPGTNTYQITLTATGTVTRLMVTVGAVGGSGTTDLTITLPAGKALKIPNSDIFFKSDCLDIRENHPETVLVEYSNQRNFDGLVYENQSPDISFNIRIPGRFYHETEPEEDEAIELTSSIVTTSAQVKTQRLLEIKHGPYYWHKKLRRVLKHQSLTIFDKSWKKEERYELIEGRKTWPLKSATCLLTETNSVVRNVL